MAEKSSREKEDGIAQSHVESPWEWAAAGVGALLVGAVVSFLAYEAATLEGTPPEIQVRVDSVSRTSGGFLVHLQARNRGGPTAAAVGIEGELRSAPRRSPLKQGPAGKAIRGANDGVRPPLIRRTGAPPRQDRILPPNPSRPFSIRGRWREPSGSWAARSACWAWRPARSARTRCATGSPPTCSPCTRPARATSSTTRWRCWRSPWPPRAGREAGGRPPGGSSPRGS